jgi:hypothetical protein
MSLRIPANPAVRGIGLWFVQQRGPVMPQSLQNTVPYLEHRWGERLACHARVQVQLGEALGEGRLRDASISGAFIETALELPPLIMIKVRLIRDDGSLCGKTSRATVVRRAHGGVGVEWCDTATQPICHALGCTSTCEARPKYLQPVSGT